MTNRTIVLGRLMITVAPQAGGHPWVDKSTTFERSDRGGRTWVSRSIRPSIRRRCYRSGGRALVIGWDADGWRK